MNFQNHRAPGTNRASVIIECRFVSCSDLAQGGSRSLDYLANSKTAPDLHELTTGNDDFVLGQSARCQSGSARSRPDISCRKMVNDQNESRCTIIDYGSGFGSAK
jgi:hypothetical protein